tara:strand:+ start:427 stop:633 length:207 start_codon:yes stop_codon:yes gene_type:complete
MVTLKKIVLLEELKLELLIALWIVLTLGAVLSTVKLIELFVTVVPEEFVAFTVKLYVPSGRNSMVSIV